MNSIAHTPSPSDMSNRAQKPGRCPWPVGRLAEHYQRRGVEALVPQPGAELPLERVRRHVLLVEDLHRQHDRVEVGPTGRRAWT